MRRPEGLDRKISVEQGEKKKISVDRAQVIIGKINHDDYKVDDHGHDHDDDQVSKLGLAVNSLVFGGFQPVDVLADIRYKHGCQRTQSAWGISGSSKTRNVEGTSTSGGFTTMAGCRPCWRTSFKAGLCIMNDDNDGDDDGGHHDHHPQAAIL